MLLFWRNSRRSASSFMFLRPERRGCFWCTSKLNFISSGNSRSQLEQGNHSEIKLREIVQSKVASMRLKHKQFTRKTKWLFFILKIWSNLRIFHNSLLPNRHWQIPQYRAMRYWKTDTSIPLYLRCSKIRNFDDLG